MRPTRPSADRAAKRVAAHIFAGQRTQFGWIVVSVAGMLIMGDVATAQSSKSRQSDLPKFYSLKSNPVNLRTGPGLKFPKAWIYRREGLPVEVLRTHERWRQVRDSDGATGWILRTLISSRRTALVAPWLLKNASRPTIIDTGPAAASGDQLIALRSGPRARASVAAQLEAGTLVNLKTCDGRWCHVSIARFRGYVEQKQLWGVYPREVLR